MSENQHALIVRLNAKIAEALNSELRGVRTVALLDFPNYANVGDSAIYLGELEYLRREHGLSPRYVCSHDIFNSTAMTKAIGDGVVLLQGGGNFGDLWPKHQEFREVALEKLRGRRVVQLPQSIHFESNRNLRRAADLIAAHGNFLLLVRDQRSFDLASRAFQCEVRLCPDMAFALGPLARSATPRHDVVMLLRTDKERSATPATTPQPGVAVVDWLSEPTDLYETLRRRSVVSTALSRPHRLLDRNLHRARLYKSLARHRLARGVALLSSGRRVITDRLHGHILSLLVGIPHVALDNSYGKVGGFIESWTHESDLVEIRKYHVKDFDLGTSA